MLATFPLNTLKYVNIDDKTHTQTSQNDPARGGGLPTLRGPKGKAKFAVHTEATKVGSYGRSDPSIRSNVDRGWAWTEGLRTCDPRRIRPPGLPYVSHTRTSLDLGGSSVYDSGQSESVS